MVGDIPGYQSMTC